MITVLAEPGMIKVGALLALDPQEAHHLQVRRAASGDSIRLIDGRGTVGTGVVSLARKEARVEVREAVTFPPPAPLLLGVGGGDRERFAWMVEKCAELGVTAIVPLTTTRSANVAGRIRPEHSLKLARRALEACKQSGNPWTTAVDSPMELETFLASLSASTRLAAEPGGAPVPPTGAGESIAVLIGPEGGWTTGETAASRQAGFIAVSLAPHTLRFETAAVAAAALIVSRRS